MKYKQNKIDSYHNWQKKLLKNKSHLKYKKELIDDKEFIEFKKEIGKIRTNIKYTLTCLGVKYNNNYLESLVNYVFENRFNIVPQNFATEDGTYYFFRNIYDKTGYKKLWEVKELNYTALSKKFYKVDLSNRLTPLKGIRGLFWIKINQKINEIALDGKKYIVVNK